MGNYWSNEIGFIVLSSINFPLFRLAIKEYLYLLIFCLKLNNLGLIVHFCKLTLYFSWKLSKWIRLIENYKRLHLLMKTLIPIQINAKIRGKTGTLWVYFKVKRDGDIKLKIISELPLRNNLAFITLIYCLYKSWLR